MNYDFLLADEERRMKREGVHFIKRNLFTSLTISQADVSLLLIKDPVGSKSMAFYRLLMVPTFAKV